MGFRSVNFSPEGLFLIGLFEVFNTSGIRYAVMRNHLTLPFSAGGSDLDLIVDEADEAVAKVLIAKAISKAGGTSLGSIQTYGFYKVFALGRNVDADGGWWGLCIDINFGLFFQGQRLLAKNVQWPTNNYRGITVLTEDFAGVLGVLKEVLNNRTMPQKYSDAARKGVLCNWQEISCLLAPMGVSTLNLLHKLLLSDNVLENRVIEFDLVRNAFFRHALISKPVKYLVGRSSYEWSKAKRYFNPSGKVVAILGVDGAGKSTIINAIKPVLDMATHNTVVVQHLRPTIFPPLSRLKGKAATINVPVLDPHEQKPSGKAVSLFRLVYLMLDYVFGYWLKTRPMIAKQPTLVIFDRYAYDIIIDPLRFRIGLPAKLIRAMVWIAPKPDLIICLYGNPRVLQIRKLELPLGEVERQVRALKQFASTRSNSYLVSTEKSISETSSDVLKIMLKKC